MQWLLEVSVVLNLDNDVGNTSCLCLTSQVFSILDLAVRVAIYGNIAGPLSQDSHIDQSNLPSQHEDR